MNSRTGSGGEGRKGEGKGGEGSNFFLAELLWAPNFGNIDILRVPRDV